jgi:hypothetical protein
VEDDDVAFTYWQIWVNHDVTRGIFWINGVVPRGPVMGCHVAPLYWLLVQNFMESMGFEPRTSPPCKALAMAALPACHALFLINYMF